MTASLAYLLGSGNSLVWSWFFWVYVHPLASIAWFVFCLFTLLISIEVHQLQKSTEPLINSNRKSITGSREVIDVIVIPPPQLSYSRMKTPQQKTQSLATAQLPNSFD